MLALAALREARVKGDILSPVQYAPNIEVGVLTMGRDLRLLAAVNTAAQAWANERAARIDQAIADWKKIFGSELGE
jgi:hypothetical protein